jgi:hypothetical protein
VIETSRNLPLTLSLCKEGERYFQRGSTESLHPENKSVVPNGMPRL